MYNDNRIMAMGEKYFASTGRKFQFHLDEQDARDERLAELAEAYEKEGDFYDAIGSTLSDQKINQMYAARKLGNAEMVFALIDEIMECAADGYAETMIAREEKENEARTALANARKCGRKVPDGFDD